MRVLTCSSRYWSVRTSIELSEKRGKERMFRFIPSGNNVLYVEMWRHEELVCRTSLSFDDLERLARADEEAFAELDGDSND